MTLDGKIATASGESKWITSAQAREFGMKLRRGADAILVGVNTVLADDPSLTVRRMKKATLDPPMPGLRRIVLDSMARTPLNAKVVSDEHAALTMVVVGRRAPQKRVASLANRVHVMVAPERKSQISNFKSQINLPWLLKKLGAEGVTSLLVEGGGEVNASFLLGGLAHRVAFFYAPKIIGGRNCRPAVAGEGAAGLAGAVNLADIRWRRLGPDLLLTARVAGA
jgi:diaminohydroxyphosphoribosylaminopyrimidine deaminase/5-amino-6-(5-phosphoribosylamino)uracil reductase